jgi:hypothetical protein
MSPATRPLMDVAENGEMATEPSQLASEPREGFVFLN